MLAVIGTKRGVGQIRICLVNQTGAGTMPIQFACTSCGKQYRVKDDYAGKPAKCGDCGHRMRIPKPDAQATSPAPKPKPAPKPVAKPVSAAAPTSDLADLGSWMDEELDVAPPAPPTTDGACPSCSAPMVGNAVVCVVCGHDKRSGEKLATETVAPGKRKKSRSGSFVGSAAGLLLGTGLSFVGAIIGSVVWALVAYWTNYQIGWIAIGLGALAGGGMALGCRDNAGPLSGVIAAGISFVGIVFAKILLVFIYATSMGGDMDFTREAVVEVIAYEQMEEQGLDEETVTDEQWEGFLSEAESQIANLSDEQVVQHWEEIQAKQLAEFEAEQAEIAAAQTDVGETNDDDTYVEEGDVGGGVVALGVFAVIFLVLFSFIGIFDILFVILAMSAAYSLGSGQGFN
jgi:DNA-directed RNA polymerase subunit RPC12/RpoP